MYSIIKGLGHPNSRVGRENALFTKLQSNERTKRSLGVWFLIYLPNLLLGIWKGGQEGGWEWCEPRVYICKRACAYWISCLFLLLL